MTGRACVCSLFRALAAILVLAAVASLPAAALERRVALVVGASSYVAVPHLANTLSDATEVATALRHLSFDVDLVTDPDRAALESAVRRLGERASGADAALFFFAGHGVEVAGRNWLLPVSARPKMPRDLPFEALDLGLIFDQLDGAARVSLFFLDACRDSPFRLQLTQGSRGAATVGMRAQQAASGSLIAYATAPGTEAADGTGPHSPFTTALLKYIEKPGLTVQQVLNAVRGEVKAATRGRQVPWESSALEGDFYFVQSHAAAPLQVAGGVAPLPGSGLAAEDLFFKSIMETRRPEELRAFLERFPSGTYAPLVRSWSQRQPPPTGNSTPAATPTPVAITVPAPADLSARLTEALRKALPALSDQARQGLVKRFADSPPSGRAMAVYPPTGMRAEASGNPDAASYVLERCAFRAGRPCVLIAEGNEIAVPDATGLWPRRSDTTLFNYTGLFEPAMVPLVKPEIRARREVVGYRALKGPKAAALTPDALYIETAATQHDAEQRALDACSRDPARSDAGCFLYAVGDGVVLPRWHSSPETPALESSARPAKEVEQIAAAARLVRLAVARTVRLDYLNETEHKAIAVHLASGFSFRWNSAATAALAERWVLEGCQIKFNGPCVLLAVDLDARTSDPRTTEPAAMERVAYAGPFRLDRVPMGMERYEVVQKYAQLPGERAIAIRPNRAVVKVASGKATRVEAEREALAQCNNPADDPSPCFLYASGDQVVLPLRRTETAR
nr:hypothetical protein Hi04_10k_c377_00009 [uncultured bacterium]